MFQPTCNQIIVHQSRFRKRNLDLIPKYFVEIVRKAYEIGVSEFKEISIDGTKLPAVSSRKKSMPTGLLVYCPHYKRDSYKVDPAIKYLATKRSLHSVVAQYFAKKSYDIFDILFNKNIRGLYVK